MLHLGLDPLAQALLVDDLEFALAGIMGLQEHGSSGPVLGLLFTPLWARYTYEAALCLDNKKFRLENPKSSPVLSTLTRGRELSQARNAVKLVDVKGGFELMTKSISEMREAHDRVFRGSRLGRLWGRDLGVFRIGENQVGTTWSIHLQMGLAPALIEDFNAMRQAAFEFATEIGTAVSSLANRLEIHNLSPVDWGNLEVRHKDYVSERFFRVSVLKEMDPTHQILLATIGHNVGFLAMVARHAPDTTHNAALTRARYVAVYHAVDTLSRLERVWRNVAPVSAALLAESVVDVPAVLRNRRLRDRFVHYRSSKSSDDGLNFDQLLDRTIGLNGIDLASEIGRCEKELSGVVDAIRSRAATS